MGNQPPRSRGMMYVQQWEHLPVKDAAALKRRCQGLTGIDRWAFITHDQDQDAQGQFVAPHVHVMLVFQHPRTLSAVAKELGDQVQYVESVTKHHRKDGIANGFAYLVHRTVNARNKYQYDPHQVVANFDYPAYLAQLQERLIANQIRSRQGLRELLTQYVNEKYSRRQVMDLALRYRPTAVRQLAQELAAIDTETTRQQAERWLEQLRTQHQPKIVVWLSGPAGTGKTVLANMLAQWWADETGWAVNGSSRDYFQDYHGEHVLVIDDLRPATLPYEDLLRITDPHNYRVELPARYHDRQLLADKMVITSPYQPWTFYQHDNQIQTTVDDFAQLNRRITVDLRLTTDEIKWACLEKASKTEWQTEVLAQEINPVVPEKLAQDWAACQEFAVATISKLLAQQEKLTTAQERLINELKKGE